MSSACWVPLWNVFVKVHVHSMSNEICDMLMPDLWWQKAPMWFLFVNPALHPNVVF